MSRLDVDLVAGRTACMDSIGAFSGAIDRTSEHDLLGASRCHGWSRLDVVVHVTAGWQEMLGGLVSPSDSAPSVDAASYWRAFAATEADADPVATLMSQRRRTSAYLRPSSATEQARDVAEAVLRGVRSLEDRPVTWQGHVFSAGDYLAVWAVEVVVHQLDLLVEGPAPSSALALARATVASLVTGPLPSTWSDLDATLIGAGRMRAPDGTTPELATGLPALG